MPAGVTKITKSGNKTRWRVTEPDGSVVKNAKGTAVDGGGHTSKAAAERQAKAINISQRSK